MKKRILTSGVDSEYVLGNLCEYLRRNSWDVTEIDFGTFKTNPRDVIKDFQGKDTVYITSAHTNLTLRLAESVVPMLPKLYPNYLAPIEFISAIKPSLSIYVPHDLLTPYGDSNLNEFRYLDLFDYILAPIDSPALQAALGATTKVISAGWIKHAALQMSEPLKTEQDNFAPRVALFVSMIEHLRLKYGADGVVDYLMPLLKPNVRIKLPAWHGVDQIEAALKARGQAEVIPSGSNSIELILDSDVIICNGASSIHAEAALMGRPAICLLDNEGISVSVQKSKLKDFPNIHFHDYRSQQTISNSTLESISANNRRPPAPPFDFASIEQLILSAG